MKLVPFLTEGEKGYVIFRLERDGEPDAYIWVDGYGNMLRVTSFYAVASIFTHNPEPMMIASDEYEEEIDKALEKLKEYPKDKLEGMFEKFDKNVEAKQQDEEEWKEYCDWEESAKKDVEEAKKNRVKEIVF